MRAFYWVGNIVRGKKKGVNNAENVIACSQHTHLTHARTQKKGILMCYISCIQVYVMHTNFFLLRIPPCQDFHLGSQCHFFFPCLFSRWSRHSCSQNTRAVGIYIVARGAQVPLNINRRLWASHFGENGLVSNLINATKREKKMHAVPSPKHFIRSKTALNPLGVPIVTATLLTAMCISLPRRRSKRVHSCNLLHVWTCYSLQTTVSVHSLQRRVSYINTPIWTGMTTNFKAKRTNAT